ncbi:MAG: hypothetical protein AAFO29_16170, partial [Actinomycetota bacterium]
MTRFFTRVQAVRNVGRRGGSGTWKPRIIDASGAGRDRPVGHLDLGVRRDLQLIGHGRLGLGPLDRCRGRLIGHRFRHLLEHVRCQGLVIRLGNL